MPKTPSIYKRDHDRLQTKCLNYQRWYHERYNQVRNLKRSLARRDDQVEKLKASLANAEKQLLTQSQQIDKFKLLGEKAKKK